MPGGNGMGPMGMGPMTGWGRGACSPMASEGQPFTGRGFGRGRGIGGGWGRRNRFNAAGSTGWQEAYAGPRALNEKGQSESLKAQAEYLSAELEAVRAKLTALDQNKER